MKTILAATLLLTAISLASAQTILPTPPGAPETISFNYLGQIESQTDADSIATTFAYNGQGERTTTTVGARVISTESSVQTNHGSVVQAQRRYSGSGANRVLLSETENSVDSLKSWQTTYTQPGVGIVSSNQTIYATGGARYSTNTAPDGSVTVNVYQYGRLQSVTRKLSASGAQLGATSYGYDAFGRVQSSTDARNGTTWFSYDNAGQVVSTTTPEPGNGQAAQTTSTVFDTQGRALRVTQPDGTAVTNEYTLAGQIKKTYGSRAYPVEYTFDAQGRMKTMKTWQDFSGDSGTATTTWYYDTQRGWLTNKTYQGGLGITYTNTSAGRLKWRQWARGTTTTYSYTPEGDLASLWYSDATPGVTNVYDALGRLAAVTNGTIVCLRSNNLAGALLSEKWLGGPLDGWWATNHFDSLQRRDTLQVFSGSTLNMQHDFAYDTASRLIQVSQGNYSASYTYQPNSPLVAQIGFTNNGTGILTTTKQYDFLNRLTTIASVGTGSTPSPISFDYRYNAANQRVQANREDGAYWRYEYDKLGQVVSGKKYWSDGTPVPGMQFEYGFDDIGNRKSTAAGGNQSGTGLRPASYSANLLNQYTNRTVPGGFDVLGAASATNSVTVNTSPADYRHGEFFQELITANNTNATLWQSVKVTNTTSGAYETGAVFLAQSPESFTHDADGNLTHDGRWDYTWDGENRLIAMETRSAAYNAGAPRQKLLFGYDWQGRRISKTVSNWVSGNWALASTRSFIYDGWNLLAILNPPSSILQQFLWGLDLSGSLQGAGGVGGLVKIHDASMGKNYFPAYDGNGNVMTLVDSDSGAEAARYEYGPFGEAQVVAGSYALANPFRFSTKFTDEETSFLYYGYRYYIPGWGRWASRDPIEDPGLTFLAGGRQASTESEFDEELPTTTRLAAQPKEANPYGFALGNPLARVDRLGLISFEGCTEQQKMVLSDAWRSGCDKVRSSAFKCCVGHFNIPQRLVYMCDHPDAKLHSITIKCQPRGSGVCSKRACGVSFPGGSTIHICGDALTNPGCIAADCILLHEMTHMIGHGFEKWPVKVQNCLGCDRPY